MTPMPPAPVILGAPRTRTILTITRWRHWLHWTRPKGRLRQLWGERSGAPSGLRPSSFVMCNTPVEVQFTSAGCLNYRTPSSATCDLLIHSRCRGDKAPMLLHTSHSPESAVVVAGYRKEPSAFLSTLKGTTGRPHPAALPR